MKADPRTSREELIFLFVFSGPASIVYDESGNKELEDDRDSQDDISVLPPSRYVSRAPSMAPSRIHSVSNTPQTSRSPIDEGTAVGSQISQSHSTNNTAVETPISRTHSTISQSHSDRHPESYAESSVSKKS